MVLYVTRHGQTNGNIERVIDGCRRDLCLNETGISQAKNAKEFLKDVKIDLIICSPLIRTRQTAKIININNVPEIIEPRLIERDSGEFTGMSFDSFDRELYWNYNDTTKYESVENIRDFFKRIYEYLDYIKEEYKDKTVLLVTHGGVTKVINCYFNGIPDSGSLKNLELQNCEVAKYVL